jgi:hypothetical protein
MPLSELAKDRIAYVAAYVQDSITDWFVLKIEILRAFGRFDRKKLGMSRRHPSTEKLFVNEADREIMEYWELLTGIKPFVDETKLHDPNWVYRPSGWRLAEINEKRKAEREAAKSSKNHSGTG